MVPSKVVECWSRVGGRRDRRGREGEPGELTLNINFVFTCRITRRSKSTQHKRTGVSAAREGNLGELGCSFLLPPSNPDLGTHLNFTRRLPSGPSLEAALGEGGYPGTGLKSALPVNLVSLSDERGAVVGQRIGYPSSSTSYNPCAAKSAMLGGETVDILGARGEGSRRGGAEAEGGNGKTALPR